MSQFVIGLNKYLESIDNGFKVGMRFKMRFEGEDTPERRYFYFTTQEIRSLVCHFILMIGLCN